MQQAPTVPFIEARYAPDQLVTASPLRRLGGWAVDGLIAFLGPVFGFVLLLAPVAGDPPRGAAGLALLAPLLLFSWLIWFAIVAPRGQTPGKQLMGMYIMRTDGTRAGGSRTWLREIVVEGIVFGLLGGITGGIAWVVGALWLLWDRDRQALWDKVTDTYVAYSPSGFVPLTAAEHAVRGVAMPSPSAGAAQSTSAVAVELRELARLREESLITDEEYEVRRTRLVDRL